MYPYEVATMVEILGRQTPGHQPDGDRSPVPTSAAYRIDRLRQVAGRQVIRLGEALAGRRPGTSVPLTARTHQQ